MILVSTKIKMVPLSIVLNLVGFFIVADQAKLISTTSIIGDTKLWIRDTDLINELNWKRHEPPCMDSMNRRIIIKERAAIAIPSRIRSLGQIVLPDDGLLLFDDQDDRTLGDTAGDCSANNSQTETSEQQDFVFTLDDYYMSWFNPANWNSALYNERLLDPHSHQIPCWQDKVELGFNQSGFKISFNSNKMNTYIDDIDSIRISELSINKVNYDNEQLVQLMQSNEYHNLLFNVRREIRNLNSERAVNKDIIIIDPSSLNDNGYCTDDAGCICGNEEKRTMERICSFVSDSHSYDDNAATCDDPIYSTGYCNKLCATVLDIFIMPSKFQAKYFENLISSELYAYDENLLERKYANKVHVVSRRVHDNKFEVTFLDKSSNSHGPAHELATSIQSHLLRGKLVIRITGDIIEHCSIELIK